MTSPTPPCACPPGYEDGGCVFPPGTCGRSRRPAKRRYRWLTRWLFILWIGVIAFHVWRLSP